MLAIKNYIQSNRQALRALPVRYVFIGILQSLVVLLYGLMYMSENETNFMVRVTCFFGLAIEIWKTYNVVDINYNTDQKMFGILPKISFKDILMCSPSTSTTKEDDNLAFKYLSWSYFPFMVGSFIYSLLYDEQKGWNSFILNMIDGYLVSFGFVMMTSHLFINYKLKTVAHMSCGMITYKFLNTFLDDIFALVIKMPTMYRLGCFRDDIVFFVFLYQRWQYRVDLKRVNEFGSSGKNEEEAIKQKLHDTVSVINDLAAALTDAASKHTEDMKED